MSLSRSPLGYPEHDAWDCHWAEFQKSRICVSPSDYASFAAASRINSPTGRL